MISDFADWVKGIYSEFIYWILALLLSVLNFLLDALLWVGQKLWELVLAGLASVIESLPVPSFLNDASGFFSQLPSTIIWGLNFFAVGQGLTFILTALVLRFVLRRIPFIG